MVLPESFQRRCVGGVAGLRLLARGEAQLLEEHLTKLRCGVHVELLSGGLVHLPTQPLAVRRQAVAQAFQLEPVHADAQLLHPGQHGDEGHLEGGVEVLQALGFQARLQGCQEVACRRSPGARLGSRIRCLPGEVQLPVRRPQVTQPTTDVPLQQRPQVVAGLGRVQEVRSHGGVHDECHLVKAQACEGSQHWFGVVGDDPGSVRPQQEADRINGVGEQVLVDPPGPPAIRECDAPAQTGAGPALRRTLDRGHSERRSGERPYGRQHPIRVDAPLHHDLKVLGGCPAGIRRTAEVHAQEWTQVLPGAAQLKHLQEAPGALHVDRTPCHVVHPETQRHVAHQDHHLLVQAGQGLVLPKVLAELGRLLRGCCEHPVQPAIGVDELCRRLLPHARNTGKVVGGVTPKGGIGDVVHGTHAGSLQDAGLVVEGVVGHATLVVENPDMGVLHQLVAVAVAGHDGDVPA